MKEINKLTKINYLLNELDRFLPKEIKKYDKLLKSDDVSNLSKQYYSGRKEEVMRITNFIRNTCLDWETINNKDNNY